MKIIKKILNSPFFILVVFVFFFVPLNSIYATAQCTGNDSNSQAVATSYETRTQDFGNMSACNMFCPGGGTCSSPGICTYTITTNTTYANCAAYCSAGYVPQGAGYCIPSGAISCGGQYNCTTADIGSGYCQDTCQCSTFTVAGNINAINGACVSSSCNCNKSPTGTYCQFSQSGGTATFPPYVCTVPTGNPPTGVNVKATVWTDSTRTTAFAGQADSDGPVSAFSQAPYKISWLAPVNATSCTLNGSSVAVSAGNVNTLTVPLGTVTITYTLTCSNSSGSSSDSVTLNIPPPPTNQTGSCPAPGTTGTFSWTAPSGYNTFYTRANNDTSGATLIVPPTDDNFVGTSKSFTTTVNNSYTWWLHTKNTTTGAWSDPVSGSFNCAPPSTCVAPPALKTATSGFSPTNVQPNDNVSIRCDYGETGDYITSSLSGSGWSSCTWGGFTGTVANFTCKTSQAGLYTVSCSTFNVPAPGSNKCSTSTALPGSLQVGTPATAPVIDSPTATSITTTDATLGARVVSDGGSSITGRGTCWGTTVNPTTNCLSASGTTGIFTHVRNSMSPSTLYHYRGYATNSVGTSYTSDATFTTATAAQPNLTVSDQVTPVSAIAGTATSFTDTIKNIGTASTGTNFQNNFQVATAANGGGTVSSISANFTSTSLAAGTNVSVTSSSYTFSSAGQYSVRVCADNNASMVGSITESNEGDNCGPWTTISVSASPTASISANPSSGVSPVSTQITWSSGSATTCTATGGVSGWPGNKTTSGTQNFTGLTSNTAFNIYCSNGSTNSPTVTANVVVNSPQYSLNVNKTTGGYVKSSDNFISCGYSCSKTYTSGTDVTLTAYSDSTSWKFVGWTGDCGGSSSVCILNINSSKSVTAIFTPRPFIYKEF